jgi:glycosyltransferase involved in cell wall biosynthesis
VKQKDIVCVALPTWEGDYMKTIVQIMSLLARRHRVLYVDYTFTWKDMLMGAVGKRNTPWQRMLGLEPRLRNIKTRFGSEVHVLTPPPVMPANWIAAPGLYKQVMEQEGQKLRKSISKAMRELNFENPIVINAFNPFFGVPLAGKLNESLLVYYCYDEISAAQWCGRHGAQQEKQFLGLADAVITSSQALLESKSKLNAQTTLVKNGVDYALFHEAFTDSPRQTMPKVIGYLGSVDDRLDAELLQYCFEQLPAYKFVFTGRIVEAAMAERFSKYSNVEIRGSRAPEQLPSEVKSFDVGIIPFACNAFTRTIYPLKINEYLAAGLPVVMTDFARLDDFVDVAYIASDKEGFVKQLKLAAEQDSPQLRTERARFAKTNSWESRVDELEAALENALKARQVAIV